MRNPLLTLAAFLACMPWAAGDGTQGNRSHRGATASTPAAIATLRIEPGDGDYLAVPRLAWGCGMAHKTIRAGLCPGGRARMERMIELVRNKRVDPSLMATHVSHGLEHVEQGILLMKDKPADLIKPVIIIDY